MNSGWVVGGCFIVGLAGGWVIGNLVLRSRRKSAPETASELATKFESMIEQQCRFLDVQLDMVSRLYHVNGRDALLTIVHEDARYHEAHRDDL